MSGFVSVGQNLPGALGTLVGWDATSEAWLMGFAMRPEFMPLWGIHEEAGHLRSARSLERRQELTQQCRSAVGTVPDALEGTLTELGRCHDATGEAIPWGDVALHCLVEAARGEVLGPLLGLSPQVSACLTHAALVHDAAKLEEILGVRSAPFLHPPGSPWDAYAKAGKHLQEQLGDAGCDPLVMHLASAAGHGSLKEVARVLQLETLTQEEIAYLALHYIDDYTFNSNPVTPASKQEDGKWINDFDRRMEKNARNPNYDDIDREAADHFDGQTMHAFQRRTGFAVQDRIAELIARAGGPSIEPHLLPEVIEARLRERMQP